MRVFRPIANFATQVDKGYRNIVLICVLLAVTTLAVYWQVRHYDFVNYDDPIYITENPIVQQGVTARNIQWAVTRCYYAYWHPLTWMSHMLDCQLFGVNSGAHHLTNVGFHIANTLLLFLLLWRMTDRLERSAFVAGLFALHPLHVESVAWIAERKDVLSTFFWLLTMYAYAAYVKRPAFRSYMLAFVCFALGLLSKPMLVTLPFVLLLMDYWPLGRLKLFSTTSVEERRWAAALKSVYSLALEKLPFFTLTIVSCAMTLLTTKSAMLSLEKVPMGLRLANLPISYARYLGKTLSMDDLAVLYPFPARWEAWQVVGASVLVFGISLIAIATVRRRPYIVVGWLWFLGTLVPTIGLVTVGFQSIADRYTYVSLIGIFILMVWGAADLVQRWPVPKIAVRFAGILALGICAGVTFAQLTHWQNSETLWAHAVAVTRDNPIAHYNLGTALTKQRRMEESLHHYGEAVRIKPDYVEAHLNRGATLMHFWRVDEATNAFAKALSIDPDYDQSHNCMGSALLALGQPDAAEHHFAKAVARSPKNAVMRFNLGVALFRQGRLEEAITHLAEARRLDPVSPEIHFCLGEAYYGHGQTKEAIIHYREALRLRPHFPGALNDLAWILATHPDAALRNAAEAVRFAEKACELTSYRLPLFVGTLAAAYAEAGDFDKAVSTARKARDLAEASGEKNLVAKNEKLMEQYRAGKPCRETGQL